ncbi:MAG: hypothetical protein QUS11_01465 [Candidatus Fermentibacter sp.]|nr:hypothetical protein [Candidatus Fermentibacter sp.]
MDIVRLIVILAPALMLALLAGAWLLMRRTMRTRIEMDSQLKKDSEISEWLVIFGWTSKIIYAPTVILSLLFFGLSFVPGIHLGTLGAVWLAVFLFNFIIEEYEVGMKELLIFLLAGAALFVWLYLVGVLSDIVTTLGEVDARMNGFAYLAFALIFLFAIGVSWVRGLFNYVAITPNYINVQRGPTESGQQISREDYSTIIDTGDLLERMLGFGKIIISFRDAHRQPISLLVWGIGRKSRRLESIRGTITIEGRRREDMPVPPVQ